VYFVQSGTVFMVLYTVTGRKLSVSLLFVRVAYAGSKVDVSTQSFSIMSEPKNLVIVPQAAVEHLIKWIGCNCRC
jgi:hypothetical protein